MKVIASSLRKGNIVELDGKLYVVLNAESFHPGKGTPTTQIDMRRISDGVKMAQRYKTTEQVERAFVEEQEHQFLYQDGDGFHFMNTENYDQVTLQADLVGDQAAYLQPEMKVDAGGPRGRAGLDRTAAEGDARSGGDRAVDQEPDRRLVLQAGRALQRRAHHGAALRRPGHQDRGDDRRRLLRRARQGLKPPPASNPPMTPRSDTDGTGRAMKGAWGACLLAALLLTAGTGVAPAQEMASPRLLRGEVDWDAARIALDRIDQLRVSPDELSVLNKATDSFFPNIAASPVPVLLPFDTAAYFHDYATETLLKPVDGYLSSFHLSPFFLAGPAGYDAVFNAYAGEMPDLGSTFPYRIDIQLSGAPFVYDLGEPAGMIEWPANGLDQDFPGIRHVFLENYVRYAFKRYGVFYVVSIACFDGSSRYRQISCRDADKVAARFLKALNIAGGNPSASTAIVEPKTIDRPDAVSAVFTYHSPGSLMPGTGTRGLGGRPDRTVYAGIRFPLGDAPAFANSQVFHGREADPTNYTYPWRDNFCERRYFYVGQCPGGLGHQGQDIRPASCRQQVPGARCELYQHDVVAVRDGMIMRAPGQQAVYVAFNAPNERVRVRYLHMLPQQLDLDGILSGRVVHEGEVSARWAISVAASVRPPTICTSTCRCRASTAGCSSTPI